MLKIYTNGIIYSMPASAYTTSGYDGHSSGCSLLVGYNKADENESRDFSIVLGLAFLTQYTSSFNVKDRSLTLAPSKYAVDGISTENDPDSPDNQH